MDLARLAAGVLHLPEPAPAPVRFAAEELTAYLGRMFGVAPVARPHAGVPGTWLHLSPPGQPPPAASIAVPDGAEATVRPAGDGMAIAAVSPRALLAAVYALLAEAGCRWSPSGVAEEHVPVGTEVRAAVPALILRPPFARRAYASDLATWHYTMPARLAERLPADVAFVDWMAKSGATGLLFIRHANDSQWLVPELVPELVRRGLDVEAGGHVLVELLPRALHDRHPEYFPLGADGRRTDLGNACASSREALAVIGAGARAASAATGASDLHLWPLDLLGGGWCRCAACAPFSPSDQALGVCNHVAEGMAGRVYHLAYHDTLTPPRTVRPHPRVWAEFAPRERCYAHPLDHPACATNAPYRAALERHLELFDGRVHVFEYYGDAILFGGCATPLTQVIAGDLAYYRRAGVGGVSCLTFGQYSLWAYGVNLEAFARAVTGGDARAAVAEAARRHGAASLGRYLAALERLMARVVTYGDVQAPPRHGPRAEAAHAALGATLAEAPAVRHLLAEAARETTHAPHLAAESHLLEYTLETLAAVHAWLGARLASTSAAGGGNDALERAVAALADAIRHVRAADPRLTGTWGAYDLELTHHFFAAGLRADHDPRPDPAPTPPATRPAGESPAR
jgi:hypothetical protein